MRRVGWQAQLMNLFPHANAYVRRIEVGALLGQLLASPFGALIFLMREALGGSLDEVACAGQRHMSFEHQFQWRSRSCNEACADQAKGYGPNYRLHDWLQRGGTFASFEPRMRVAGRHSVRTNAVSA